MHAAEKGAVPGVSNGFANLPVFELQYSVVSPVGTAELPHV